MCGIIGYVGPRECKPLLLHGLERLEYRGYDSAGIALLEESGLAYTRAVGNLQNLRERAGNGTSPATTGLGHTRWATHGGVTEANAHPLAAEEAETLAVVLNGIVENYRELLFVDGVRRTDFALSIRNNFYYVLFVVPMQTILAVVLAVILNNKFLKGKGFFRTAYYFPSITSSIAWQRVPGRSS